MKHFTITAFIILTIMSCSTNKNLSVQNINVPANYFKIDVVQNGDTIKPNAENIIKLKKEPFKFMVTFVDATTVYVSASKDKFYYDYPNSKKIIESYNPKIHSNDDVQYKMRFVPLKSGVEEAFNEKKDLKIGSAKYHFTWYLGKEKHPFDKDLRVENDNIVGDITVDKIKDMDLQDEATEFVLKEVTTENGKKKQVYNFQEKEGNTIEYEYPIEKVENHNIYMVFATNGKTSKNKNPNIEQREKIILQFN